MVPITIYIRWKIIIRCHPLIEFRVKKELGVVHLWNFVKNDEVVSLLAKVWV
jgi:hypothetical protein